jgi:hypothetical protein
MAAAGCAELAKGLDNDPSFASACFEPCSAGAPRRCLADGRIAICTDSGWTLNAACSWVCSTQNGIWLGACGTEFRGQLSSSGEDVCWCDLP